MHDEEHALSRVGQADYSALPPSEPDVQVSPYTAQTLVCCLSTRQPPDEAPSHRTSQFGNGVDVRCPGGHVPSFGNMFPPPQLDASMKSPMTPYE